MAEDAHYDKAAADYAVGFIECLCHTKGTWAGKPFELIDWQERIIRDIFGILKPNGYRQFNTAYVEIPKKQGKQLALDTKIPTPSGFTTMGDIHIGDTVFDENGHPCRVVAKSDVDDTEQAYRLTFRDGSSIVAGERHLWNVDYIIGEPRSVLWTTGEIYSRTMRYREKYRENDKEARRSIIRIPVAKPLNLRACDLPVDPYLYGYWLGNGCATKPEITICDKDVQAVTANVPYEAYNAIRQPGSVRVYYHELRKILVPTFRDKVIRSEYLRASERQRWELLQGLMDSDGCIGNRKAQSVYGGLKKLAPVFIIWQIWNRSKSASPCSAFKWTAEAIVIW